MYSRLTLLRPQTRGLTAKSERSRIDRANFVTFATRRYAIAEIAADGNKRQFNSPRLGSSARDHSESAEEPRR